MKTGTHMAKPLEMAVCRTKDNTDYVGAVFEIVEGECKGEHIAGRLYWTEKTSVRTKRALDAMGWQGEVDADCALLGPFKAVPIGVKEEEFNGTMSFKVDWVGENPFGGIPAKDRLTMRDARSLGQCCDCRAYSGL